MIGQVKRLFRRYAARHLSLCKDNLNIPILPNGQSDETAAGVVTKVELTNNYLNVSGFAQANCVSLENAEARRIAHLDWQPHQEAVPFNLRLPCSSGETLVTLGQAPNPASATLPKFTAFQASLAQLQLLPGFLQCVARATPAAFRWFRHKDPSARTEVRDKLGLAPLTEALRLDETLFHLPDDSQPNHSVCSVPRFVIVMPVYNAFDVLQEALDRVARHTTPPWQMVLIEDCSTDTSVLPHLRNWARKQEPRVTLLENDQNLGFIGAANRGLSHALDQLKDETEDNNAAVILLNSDALVPEGWAERLLAPISADGTVASVTPMSNDAELLTVPTLCARHTLSSGLVDHVDQVASTLPQGRYLENLHSGPGNMPTGVGFCMALGLRYLRWLPQLDTAFGEGYGEEVDWCQRAIEHGGRHVAQPRLFVEHRGGASFGEEKKQKLIAKNNAKVSNRYPHYDAQVQDFIADDPLLTARLALGLAWLSAESEHRGAASVPVFLAHSLGGGADLDLRRRIARHISNQGGAVVLRIGGPFQWQVELHSASGITLGGTDNTAFLAQLLALLPTRRMIYSCGVGDRNPATLPETLLELGQGSPGGFEVLFHDFLPLSPSYTLLGADGIWRGVANSDSQDRAHQYRGKDGSHVNLATWRASWGQLIAKADRVEVFSNDSRTHVAAAFPDHAEQITVAPHDLLHPVPKVEVRKPTVNRPVIGVLGNIGAHKGAAVLSQLSKRLTKSKTARLVLIGNLDPAYRLASSAEIHGDYEIADIPDLVAHYGISCWLIPSVWPETFSFTTHEALATGLPVLAFDLGAQGDLVADAPNGHIVPLIDGTPDMDNLLDLVAKISHGMRDE